MLYESKALIHLGVMREHFTLRNFYSEYLGTYLGTSMDMPVAEAGKYHNPERDAPSEFIMYYKGALTCLLLDISILRATNGERDLDLLLRNMYDLYGQRRGTYSNNDILNQLAKIADYPFADFFRRYVYGMESLPLSQSFTKMNLLKVGRDWKIGDELELIAALTDFNNIPVAGEIVTLYVDSTPIANVSTDSQGLARAQYVINRTGEIELEAFYHGSKDYTRLQSDASFTINVESVESATTRTTMATTTGAMLVFSYSTFLLVGIGLVAIVLVLGPTIRALRKKPSRAGP